MADESEDPSRAHSVPFSVGLSSSSLLPSARRRGVGGLVDKIIVPDEDDRDTIFQVALSNSRDIFFRHLVIRPDGGLSKQSAAKTLFTRARAFQSAMSLGFVAFNCYTVGSNFYHVLSQPEGHRGLKFALLIDKHSSSAGFCLWTTQLALAGLEVSVMVSMLLYAAWVVIKYNCLMNLVALDHYRIWHQLYSVCCFIIPTTGNFSAMRPLQCLNPQIIFSALSLELTKVEEGQNYLCVLASFFMYTFISGGLGFVAFAVKLAQLVVQLQDSINGSPYGLLSVVHQITLIFGFINQCFGITQISHVETQRLFLFIFGGEDSQMQAGELDRQETYLACVMRFVCIDLFRDLPVWKQRFCRAVALLSFTHLDIQSLVLAEDETQEVDAAVIRSQSMNAVPDA